MRTQPANPTEYLNSQAGRLFEQIKAAYLAGYGVIYLITDELDLVRALVQRSPLMSVTWGRPTRPTSVVDGLRVSAGADTAQNGFYYLPFAFDAATRRVKTTIQRPSQFLLLTNNADDASRHDAALYHFVLARNGFLDGDSRQVDAVNRSVAVVVCPEMPRVNAAITPYARVVSPQAVEPAELRANVRALLLSIDRAVPDDEDYFREITLNLRGLPLTRVEQILRRVAAQIGHVYVPVSDNERFTDLLRILRQEKEQLIANSSILRLFHGADKQASGMEQVDAYLDQIAPIIADTDAARRSALLRMPKGMIVSGIPGSGKSLMARRAARKLGNLPIIQLDMGRVMDKYVGQSEHRFEQALAQVEAMSPCLLWIDEIEKTLAGAQQDSNNDVMRRLSARLLAWMQDKEDHGVCCFVFATANSLENLPPELFRSGRFDKKFYTFMPSAEECCAIFRGITAAQQAEYDRLHQNREHPMLFQPEIFADNRFFLQLLCSDSVLRQRVDTQDTQTITLANKFVTGADIERIVEQAKVLAARGRSKHYVFSADDFRAAIVTAIGQTRTYAETDLLNIARCYLDAWQRNFEPVSAAPVVPLSHVNPRVALRIEQGDVLNHNGDHLNALENDYDRQLYQVVANAVNAVFRNRENNVAR